MKVINVNTSDDAIKLAMKLSSKYAVMIRDNIYESDKKFNGIILHVLREN